MWRQPLSRGSLVFVLRDKINRYAHYHSLAVGVFVGLLYCIFMLGIILEWSNYPAQVLFLGLVFVSQCVVATLVCAWLTNSEARRQQVSPP